MVGRIFYAIGQVRGGGVITDTNLEWRQRPQHFFGPRTNIKWVMTNLRTHRLTEKKSSLSNKVKFEGVGHFKDNFSIEIKSI